LSKQDISPENAVAQLVDVNKKLDVIVGIMQRPDSRFSKMLETAGAVVSVFGILSIIDIIRNWLGL
jgi:hypothetical protein